MKQKRNLSNVELRQYMKEKGVTFWKVADFLGISEPSMTKLFRYELEDEEREKIIKAVDAIAARN